MSNNYTSLLHDSISFGQALLQYIEDMNKDINAIDRYHFQQNSEDGIIFSKSGNTAGGFLQLKSILSAFSNSCGFSGWVEFTDGTKIIRHPDDSEIIFEYVTINNRVCKPDSILNIKNERKFKYPPSKVTKLRNTGVWFTANNITNIFEDAIKLLNKDIRESLYVLGKFEDNKLIFTSNSFELLNMVSKILKSDAIQEYSRLYEFVVSDDIAYEVNGDGDIFYIIEITLSVKIKHNLEFREYNYLYPNLNKRDNYVLKKSIKQLSPSTLTELFNECAMIFKDKYKNIQLQSIIYKEYFLEISCNYPEVLHEILNTLKYSKRFDLIELSNILLLHATEFITSDNGMLKKIKIPFTNYDASEKFKNYNIYIFNLN